mgnify:CR=1 FL=1
MTQLSLVHPRYSTTDISLAAYLHCQGYPLLSTDNQGFPTIFHFVHTPELEKAVYLFETYKCEGNIRHFYTSYKLMIEKIKGDAKGKKGNR